MIHFDYSPLSVQSKSDVYEINNFDYYLVFFVNGVLPHLLVENALEFFDSGGRYVVVTACDSPGRNQNIVEILLFFYRDHCVHVQVVIEELVFSDIHTVATFIRFKNIPFSLN